MFKIENLKINRQIRPVGVCAPVYVGWSLISDKKNTEQARYEIRVSRNSDFSDCCLKLTRESTAGVDIPLYIGNLQDFTVYYVAVNIIDSEAVETGWTETSFITGICDPAAWSGKFISAEDENAGSRSNGTYVRKEFVLEKQVRTAYVLCTALGLYELYLNGTKVGEDVFKPGWTSYDRRLLYQDYDITEKIHTGKNVCGMLIGPGWYKSEIGFNANRNVYGNRTAASAMVVIHYMDGSRQIIASDESWKGADSPLLYSEIYHGEIYDARLYDGNWAKSGFDDHLWKKVSIIPFNKAKLVPQSGCCVKEHERFPAEKIFTTPSGDTVVDFGQNLAGWVEFKITAPCGTKLEFTCFEMLDQNGNVYLANLRRAKQTILYYCGGNGMEKFHPFFSSQGFRYIRIASWYGAPEPSQFTAVAVYSDMEETGRFTCSNSLINQLQHNILWGMKSNFLDVPTDCPQRNERLGWTGDAQIFCSTAAFLMDTDLFYGKWLQDLALDQRFDGEIPHVVPDVLTKTAGCKIEETTDAGCSGSAAWADAVVINTWNLYLAYADRHIIDEQYAAMKAFVDGMYRNTVNDTWPMARQFGDWVALDAKEGSYKGATPDEMVCLGYEYYSTVLFSHMLKVIGKQAESVKYAGIAEQIKKLYQKKFFTTDGTLKYKTQTAQIISLYFKLVDDCNRRKVVEDLLDLLKKNTGHLTTGFVGTPYFCHVLSENGHTKEAYDLLLKEDFPSWLYQVKKGATTVWEHWDGLKEDGSMWSADMNSFNHYAYGSVGDWLYKVCAGLYPDVNNPGYKHFYLYPHIGGDFDWTEISYKSMYGLIRSRWERKTGRIKILCTIPANTTVTVMLDGCTHIEADGGIAFEKKNGIYTGTTGSGRYVIEYLNG
jgi:alpha-L-rhamnosidase